MMCADEAAPPVAELRTFGDYVAEHGQGLLRQAAVVAADPNSAQDIVQAVLERAFGRWGLISVMDYPDAYVRRMVTNEAISASRRVSRIWLTDRVPEPPPAADAIAGFGERDALVVEIRKLAPRQRAAIALRYFEDLSDAQIAKHLDCAEATVRGYIWRGLRALRLEIDESFGPFPGIASVEQR